MERKPLILVVDDDAPILALMESVLTEFGFRPVTARSGEEALTCAREMRPDMVLVDCQMPGMSGPEVIGRLRGETLVDGVPIVILSGFRLTSQEVKEMGADGAVTKPFDLEVLVGQIRAHLAQHMQLDNGH
jgi:DNA-binding response OmpR family regulator